MTSFLFSPANDEWSPRIFALASPTIFCTIVDEASQYSASTMLILRIRKANESIYSHLKIHLFTEVGSNQDHQVLSET